MDEAKRKKLEEAGWSVTDVEQFLGLTRAESAFIEIKLALATRLRERRNHSELTQAELAELVGSSQSRIAKMEKADPSVSIDLLVRALLALGVSREELGQVVGDLELVMVG
jgi:DNA-binding XRE family transcriptional regulator